jgi:hypothetical protein
MEPGDETRPVCKACSKKNRPCQWDAPQSKFKVYQPQDSRSATQESGPDSNSMDVDEGSEEGQASSHRTFSPKPNQSISRRNSRAEVLLEPHASAFNTSQHSPDSEPLALRESRRHSDGSHHSTSHGSKPLPIEVPQGTRPYSQTPVPLTHDEAVLVHHYTEHLGRWLDCTDATRQFTLSVPGKVKTCPVLCHAVLSFAARHRREEANADAAYHRCIPLLIDRLNERAASHDETLLCAIVILRFYEQLIGEWSVLVSTLRLSVSSTF